MANFNKGDKVIRIIQTPSGETGVCSKITKTKAKKVQLETDEHLWYDNDSGKELDPAPGFVMAGISSRIIIREV